MEKTNFSLSDFTNFMNELHEEYKNKTPNYKQDEKFRELVRPYLHMTEDEMKVAIPHGCYTISGNGLIAMTGKGGLINVILLMQKNSRDGK